MSKFTIGIDGGGTKTLGVLWNNNGELLKTVENGFCSFAVDIKQSKINLEKTINELISFVEDKTIKYNIIIGVSGYSGLKNPNIYEEELSLKYNNKVILKDDGFLALNSVLNKNNLPVVLVISGTGSIVYGLNDHNYYRFGGHGHFLGDEGSSYNVAIKAFKHVVTELDKLNDETKFTKEFMKQANLKSIEDIKQLIYNNSKNVIASHSKIVDDLANLNNKVALKILNEAANDLFVQINEILKKMNVNNKFILALRGGLVTKSKNVNKELVNLLNKHNINYVIDSSNNDPVIGALNVSEAMK